jgi:hypothetical protein
MEPAGKESRNGLGEVVRACAIPLLFITLGVLFLVDYRGGPGFGQTWPALLIVGGALWALSPRSRQREEQRNELPSVIEDHTSR